MKLSLLASSFALVSASDLGSDLLDGLGYATVGEAVADLAECSGDYVVVAEVGGIKYGALTSQSDFDNCVQLCSTNTNSDCSSVTDASQALYIFECLAPTTTTTTTTSTTTTTTSTTTTAATEATTDSDDFDATTGAAVFRRGLFPVIKRKLGAANSHVCALEVVDVTSIGPVQTQPAAITTISDGSSDDTTQSNDSSDDTTQDNGSSDDTTQDNGSSDDTTQDNGSSDDTTQGGGTGTTTTTSTTEANVGDTTTTTTALQTGGAATASTCTLAALIAYAAL